MREQKGKKGTFKGKSRTGTLKEQKTCTETAVSVSGTAKLPKLGDQKKNLHQQRGNAPKIGTDKNQKFRKVGKAGDPQTAENSPKEKKAQSSTT